MRALFYYNEALEMKMKLKKKLGLAILGIDRILRNAWTSMGLAWFRIGLIDTSMGPLLLIISISSSPSTNGKAKNAQFN